MGKELVLVTGGGWAGKSDFAQDLALSHGGDCGVLFVATAEVTDAEMEERIRRHRISRPPGWYTVEEPIDVAGAITGALAEGRGEPVVLVDCINFWVSNQLLRQEGERAEDAETTILGSADRLLECYRANGSTFILVTNEVGLGLVPTHPLGRRFRDALGRVNQVLATAADRVYLVVSGIPVELKSLSTLPRKGPG